MWISHINVLQDRLVWKMLTFTSLNDHVIELGLGLKLLLGFGPTSES